MKLMWHAVTSHVGVDAIVVTLLPALFPDDDSGLLGLKVLGSEMQSLTESDITRQIDMQWCIRQLQRE